MGESIFQPREGESGFVKRIQAVLSERYNVPLSFDTSSVLGGKFIKFDDFSDFGILEFFEHQG